MTAVLPASRDKHSQLTAGPLRWPTTQRYFLDDSGVVSKSPMHDDYAARDCPSPVASTLSSIPPSPNFPPAVHDPFACTPTTLSSLSLEDEELVLPSYDSEPAGRETKVPEEELRDPPAEWSTHPAPRTPTNPAADDSSVEEEPSRHVDYLSHEWREEDIWSSWRYVTARKNVYSNGVRLENASWRTWAKAKHNLGTISPETLNWLKDCDVTWLYGPLKTCGDSTTASDGSPPPSRLGTPSSYLDPKPILKKKTASETILQRSLSQHTLLQHAGAILKAQEAENGRTRPPLDRAHTDIDHFHHRTGSSSYSLGGTLTTTSSSGLASPSERRHIHFNDEVVQCIAVEAKEGGEGEEEEGEEEEDQWPAAFDDESSSDEGVVMMPQPPSRTASISNRSTPRGSFSGEGKTIAPLPSTTLKYRGDTPEPQAQSILSRWSAFAPASTPSPTSSVETLRPSQPSANFLLDDDDDGLDFTGQFGSAPDHDRYRSWFFPQGGEDDEEYEDAADTDRRLRRTPSGMFMPLDEGEPASASILGRMVDTVNTARDIAHVIWNVGWRR